MLAASVPQPHGYSLTESVYVGKKAQQSTGVYLLGHIFFFFPVGRSKFFWQQNYENCRKQFPSLQHQTVFYFVNFLDTIRQF